MPPRSEQTPWFRRKSGWQSRKRGGPSLLTLGAGSLAFLVLLGSFLFFILGRETGDEYFGAAEQDYKAEAYDNAIKKYDLFVEKFQKHPSVSIARVRSQLARMRKPIQTESWDRALAAVTKGIPAIRDESAFDKAQSELAGILPSIYGGFISRATNAEAIDEKTRLLEEAKKVWAFIEDPELVPGSQRRAIELRIKAIRKEGNLAQRDIDRDEKLEEARLAIEGALERNDSVKAYTVHRRLLDQFPRLRSNSQLNELLGRIANSEKKSVVVTAGQRVAATQDHRLQVPNRVALGKRREKAKTGAPGQVFVLSHGALYGLSADDGRLLWRRWLGFDTTSMPVTIGQGNDTDVAVVDVRRGEVLRLDGLTGSLVWRLPVDEYSSQVVATKGRLVLALESGKLLNVDARTGAVKQVAALPQQLFSAPAFDARRGMLYQAGAHSSVYAFVANSLECMGVYAIGHRKGSVSVPPILVGDHLLIAEQSGPSFTQLQPLLLNKEGLGVVAKRLPNSLRLAGHVVEARPVSDNSVVIVTDAGAAYIVASDGAARNKPLRIVARTDVSGKSASPHFGVSLADDILVAGLGLEQFKFQAANGQLVSRWVFDEPSVHVAAPLLRGQTLFLQYRRPGTQAIRVSALRWKRQEEPQLQWSVDLGSSPAGPPIFDKTRRSIVAVSSDSSNWEIGGTALKAHVLDKAAYSLPGRTMFSGGESLVGGGVFYAANDHRKGYLIFDSRHRGSSLQRREVRVPDELLACPVTAAGDRLIACSSAGSVYAIDADTGKPAARPYQPTMKINANTEWVKPTRLSTGELVVATRNGEMRVLRELPLPESRLEGIANQVVAGAISSPLVASGIRVFAVLRSGTSDALLCLEGKDLSVRNETPILGTYDAGPWVIGDTVALTTHDGTLHAFDGEGKVKWSSPLQDAPLVGAPLEVGRTWVCASSNGTLWRIDAKSGTTMPWETGDKRLAFKIGEPLGTVPVRMGSRLMALGRDCTLFVIPFD